MIFNDTQKAAFRLYTVLRALVDMHNEFVREAEGMSFHPSHKYEEKNEWLAAKRLLKELEEDNNKQGDKDALY